MAFIHIAKSKGFSVEAFRAVNAKVGPPQDTDGLLLQAAGSDDNGLVVVTVWQSKAHKDRYEAEQLLPVFQAAGMMADVMAATEFTEYDTDEFYLR